MFLSISLQLDGDILDGDILEDVISDINHETGKFLAKCPNFTDFLLCLVSSFMLKVVEFRRKVTYHIKNHFYGPCPTKTARDMLQMSIV